MFIWLSVRQTHIARQYNLYTLKFWFVFDHWIWSMLTCVCAKLKIWENGFELFRIGSYIQVIKIASGMMVDGEKDKKRLLLTIFLKGWGYATITLYLQTRKCWPRDNVCLSNLNSHSMKRMFGLEIEEILLIESKRWKIIIGFLPIETFSKGLWVMTEKC